MAPEAILDGSEGREGDVYSYGVLVWEVYSLGEMPLSSKTNEEVLEGLNSNDNQLSFPVCPIPHNKTNVFNDYNNYKINHGNYKTHSNNNKTLVNSFHTTNNNITHSNPNSNSNHQTHPSITKPLPISQLSDCPANMWTLIQSCTLPNPRFRPRFWTLILFAIFI